MSRVRFVVKTEQLQEVWVENAHLSCIDGSYVAVRPEKDTDGRITFRQLASFPAGTVAVSAGLFPDLPTETTKEEADAAAFNQAMSDIKVERSE